MQESFRVIEIIVANSSKLILFFAEKGLAYSKMKTFF